MARIESLKNERIKQYAKLKEKKYRDLTSQFLIEGEHLIEEALRHGLVDVLFHVNEQPFDFQGEVISVTQPVMDKLSTNVSAVNLIAVCHFMKPKVTARHRVILLDDVQDPGNVGTIIRSAVSFGFDEIILSKHCVDVYNEKVVRATQGALFQIPIVRMDMLQAISQLKQENFIVYGTAFEQAAALSKVSEQEYMAFVMGNEGKGVSPEVLDQCDGRIMIEMSRFDSLNVAVASSILMYTFRGDEVM